MASPRCRRCGKLLEGRPRTARYCTPNCRKAAHKARAAGADRSRDRRASQVPPAAGTQASPAAALSDEERERWRTLGPGGDRGWSSWDPF